MTISKYPNGFKNGVSIRNVPILNTYGGKVFWVDSGVGSNGNPGTQERPLADIDTAVGKCTANNGDIIIAKAGHTESITAAAGLDFDIAGITVYFLGEGTDRATIDFGTDVGADMDIDAANITLVNPRFTASLDALTGPIDVNSTDFTIINGEYYDGTDIDTTDCIVAGTDAARLKIYGWKYVKGNEGGTQKQSNIQLNGVDDAELVDIDIWGDFATGNIENVTDEVLNIRLENIKLRNTNSTPKPGVVVDANATGFAKNIDIRIDSGTTYISNVGKVNWDQRCVGYNADGEGPDPIGTVDAASVEGLIGTINTTTTDCLHGKIGTDTEMADNSLYDLIGAGAKTLALSTAIGSSVDGTTTDTLHGKIGTDTEMADNSLYDLIGSGAKSTDLSTAIGNVGTDVGDASARTNLQSLVAMLGNPDTASKTIYEAIKNIRETAINGSSTPTANTLSDILHKDGSYTYDNTTDSLEALADTLRTATAAGTVFTITASVTSSAIPNNTQTSANFTGASSGGDLLVEEICVSTDGTGWATPTNIEITTDNTYGLTGAGSPMILEAIGTFGANATFSSKDADTTNLPFVLESGKKLFIHGDNNAGTGAGVGKVTVKFRRMADGATIAANDLS